MFFQVVIQNALRRLKSTSLKPPRVGESSRNHDRTGFIWVLLIIATLLAMAIVAAV